METILVPTDFSPNSRHALQFAIPIAQRAGARIVLHHSWHSFLPDAQQKADTERAKLENLANELRTLGITVQTEFREGLAVDSILNFSEECKPSLIVMGTRGARDLDSAIFGSVASNVIANSKYPVLSVPANATWKGISKVVFAHDFGPEPTPQVRQLEDFAGHFNAQLHVLHVIPSTQEYSESEAEAFKAKSPQLFQYKPLELHVKPAPSVADGIAEFLHDSQAEILAMCGRHHGFLGSIFHPSLTRQHALFGHTPLLTLHE